jgi:hypothetical protein
MIDFVDGERVNYIGKGGPNIAPLLEIRTFLVGTGIVALAGLAARQWVVSMIDSRFKRSFAYETAKLQHSLSLELEKFKTDMAKDLQLHSQNTQSLAKARDRIMEHRLLMYETFHLMFSDILSNIVAVEKNKTLLEDRGILQDETIKILEGAREALECVNKHNHYSWPKVTVGVAEIYVGVVDCVTGGLNRTQVEELITKFSFLTAEMRHNLEAAVYQ